MSWTGEAGALVGEGDLGFGPTPLEACCTRCFSMTSDDGKRSAALDVVFSLLLGEKIKGRGPGRGGARRRARPEAGGFILCSFCALCGALGAFRARTGDPKGATRPP